MYQIFFFFRSAVPALCLPYTNIKKNRCRRKDSAKPLSISIATTSAMSSPINSPPTSPEPAPRTIVAPMAPTKVSFSPASIPSVRIPRDLHDAKADVDPTEWKPRDRSSSPGGTSIGSGASVSGGRTGRPSAAYHYLSQFHRPRSASPHSGSSSNPSSTASTATGTALPLPSLAHSPASASSSSSSSSLTGSTVSETPYMNYAMAHMSSAHRPLAPRSFSSSSFATTYAAGGTRDKFDLVVPCIPIAKDESVATTVSRVSGGGGAKSTRDTPAAVMDQESIWGREIAGYYGTGAALHVHSEDEEVV